MASARNQEKGADIRGNHSVLYCAGQNPYDDEPLQMRDAYRNQEEAFPDICIRSHWDPSAIANRFVFPTEHAQQKLPTDFRPFTRICTSYYTSDRGSQPGKGGILSGFANEKPPVALGGKAGRDMPFSAFSAAIDHESDLRGLPRRNVGKCDKGRYLPETPSAMAVLQTAALPESKPLTWEEQRILAEVTKPKATTLLGADVCRELEDGRYSAASARIFNNSTKLDRYKMASEVARKTGLSSPNRYISEA